MFYVKAQINDQIEMKIDLYDDEIFCSCPECGDEVQVESEILIGVLNDGGDFSSTSVFCDDCSAILQARKKNKEEDAE